MKEIQTGYGHQYSVNINPNIITSNKLIEAHYHPQTNLLDVYFASKHNLTYLRDNSRRFKFYNAKEAVPTTPWSINHLIEHEMIHSDFGNFFSWENFIYSVANVHGGLTAHAVINIQKSHLVSNQSLRHH